MRKSRGPKKNNLLIKVLCVGLMLLMIVGVLAAYSFYYVTLKHYHEISGYIDDASVVTAVEGTPVDTDSIGLFGTGTAQKRIPLTTRGRAYGIHTQRKNERRA